MDVRTTAHGRGYGFTITVRDITITFPNVLHDHLVVNNEGFFFDTDSFRLSHEVAGCASLPETVVGKSELEVPRL